MIVEKFKDYIWAEFGAQKPNAILLVPIFVAFGIGGYFSVSAEPSWFISLIAITVSFAAFIFSKGGVRFIVLSLFLIVLGFLSAQVRTQLTYTPMLIKKAEFKDVEGRISKIEDLEKGVRLTLVDPIIEDIEPDMTPRKVRLKLWKGDDYRVGQVVKGLASLNPPSPPVIPHGFDFQRYMYFQGIGAIGFFYKTPEILKDNDKSDFIEGLRDAIGGRIEVALDAPQSGLARALMIGQRTTIAPEDMEAIRVSGLAHMLAISGLHMGLFSGMVFFLVRGGMALFPFFALRYPIKKYAAVIALISAVFYMLVAGATIPTQRAMISVAVIFIAILLDRSPISLRVVAFAAFCVLMFFPESLLSASFQMSFAAVTGLVAFYDWTRPLWSKWTRQAGMVRRFFLYFGGVVATTIVASLMTAPLSIYHFQSLSVFGLLANVVCVPLLAFAVMPLAILSFLLMPFGMEVHSLYLMGPLLTFILDIAQAIAGFDHSVLLVSAVSSQVIVFVALLILSLVILKGRLRFMGAFVFGSMTLISFQWIQYDVLISSQFDLVSLRSNDPHLIVSDKRKGAFIRQNWEQYLGLQVGSAQRFPREGALLGDGYKLSCDVHACRYDYKGVKMSYLRDFDHSVFSDECAWADVVVSKDLYIDQECSAEYVLNRRDGKYHGAHGLLFKDGRVTVERVEDFRGDRPWVQIPRKAL